MEISFWSWLDWVIYPSIFGFLVWIIFYVLNEWLEAWEHLSLETPIEKAIFWFITIYFTGLVVTWFYYLASG